MRWRDPAGRGAAAWAALLSLLVPGLGQVFARRLRAALAFAAGSVLLGLAGAVLVASASRVTITPATLVGVLLIAIATVALNLAAAVHAWRAVRQGRDPEWPGWPRSTWSWGVVLVGLSLAMELLPGDLGWAAFSVPSASMLPTLEVGDRFVALGTAAARAALAPGDVIVFLLPSNHAENYVKRLVAMPGQTVQMLHGVLIIDSKPVPHDDLGPAGPGLHRWRITLPNGRSYVALKATAGGMLDDTPPTRLGPGQLFVMGDNLDDSLDSRAPGVVGPVPRDLVVGRAGVIFWSRDLHRIGTAL